MESSNITDHRFTVRRQDGIGPHPDNKPCAECGRPKSWHHIPCAAALNIKGEHFACDLTAPHDGWAHSNKTAEAIWQ